MSAARRQAREELEASAIAYHMARHRYLKAIKEVERVVYRKDQPASLRKQA